MDPEASAAALPAGASWGAAADPSRCQLHVTWRRLLGDPEPLPVLEGVAEWTGCPTQLGTDAADASSPLWIVKSKLATLAVLQASAQWL